MKMGKTESPKRGRKLLVSYGFYFVFIVLFAAFSIVSPNFGRPSNIVDILHSASPLMMLAVGLSLVIMGGNIDLSVGSVAFLAAGIGALLMNKAQMPVGWTWLIMLAVGVLLGAVNGLVVVGLRINPLIATLSTMLAIRGIGLQLTNARVMSLPAYVYPFCNAAIGPIYVDMIIAGILVLLLHVMHTRTRTGRWITAVGNSAEVASRLGIESRKVVFTTYVLSGLFASLAGILMMLQVGTVTSRMGAGAETTAIASAIVGGISLTGGEGNIFPGLVVGAITLMMIENGLIHVGASPFAYPLARGILILVAMYADSFRRTRG